MRRGKFGVIFCQQIQTILVHADMLNDFTGADKVYIACGYTDLRTSKSKATMRAF